METAMNTSLTSALLPALPPVTGESSGSTRLVSGTQMLPLGFNTLTGSNASGPMLPAAGSTNCSFIGTQTYALRPFEEPSAHAHVFSAALKPMPTPTYLAIFGAWTGFFADNATKITAHRRTYLAPLTLDACDDVVTMVYSALKVFKAATPRTSVLRSAWATPEIRAEYTNAQRIFDAIQALYLSHNTPRDRQIAQRLTTLYRAAVEEDEAIRPASISQFKDFFLAHPELGMPKITLTPDGTLRARWIQGKGNFIALEFTGTENAKLVAEIPRDNGLTATHFGSEPLKNIVTVAQGLGASFA